MSNLQNIIIFGAGGLGRGIVELIREINKGSLQWNILGFVDDSEEQRKMNDLKILGKSTILEDFKDNINVVLALGKPQLKKGVYKRLSLNKNICFPNIIHPTV